MEAKTVLIIAEKEALLVRVLLKKLKEAGVDAIFAPLKVNAIHAEWEKAALVTFFMDSGVILPSDVQVFLCDSMIQDEKQMILIGDKGDIETAQNSLFGVNIYKSLERPVDNDLYVQSVKELFGKIEAGEYRKRILIVDDDPTYLSLVREWLKESYSVDLVSSGMQAIKWLGKNKADLILLDHEMPVTSGPRVLEMLRSDGDTAGIPVIFLTGKSDKQSVMDAVEQKPDGYFLKTITKEDLLEKLHQFFELRK